MSVFLTFSNGFPLTETQIFNYFNLFYTQYVESLIVHKPRTWGGLSLFGKIMFKKQLIQDFMMENNKKLLFFCNPISGSLVVISWCLVCSHISHEFDSPYELNCHYLASMDLGWPVWAWASAQVVNMVGCKRWSVQPLTLVRKHSKFWPCNVVFSQLCSTKCVPPPPPPLPM